MKEIHELKVGDKIELRDDLEERKQYGNDTYYRAIPKVSHVESFRNKKLDIVESGYVVTPEMISKVNDKRVKFVDGFEYTIMEDEMIDPKSLVQSGDFVVWSHKECPSKEFNFLAIQKGAKILLIHPKDGCVCLDAFNGNIKKIYRYNEPYYGSNEEFNGQFDKCFGKFIYDSEKEVKEMTMEEVNKALGYKVKIVEGK